MSRLMVLFLFWLLANLSIIAVSGPAGGLWYFAGVGSGYLTAVLVVATMTRGQGDA
jgi:TM2 domain-containing membrane protein YozV